MHGTPLLSAKGNHDQGGYASGEDGVDHQQKMALPPQQQQQQPNYPGPNGQHQQPPPTLQAPPAMAYQQQQQQLQTHQLPPPPQQPQMPQMQQSLPPQKNDQGGYGKNTTGPFDPEKMAADHRDNKSIGEIGVYCVLIALNNRNPPKIWEIDWSYLCLQQFHKFVVYSARMEITGNGNV